MTNKQQKIISQIRRFLKRKNEQEWAKYLAQKRPRIEDTFGGFEQFKSALKAHFSEEEVDWLLFEFVAKISPELYQKMIDKGQVVLFEGLIKRGFVPGRDFSKMTDGYAFSQEVIDYLERNGFKLNPAYLKTIEQPDPITQIEQNLGIPGYFDRLWRRANAVVQSKLANGETKYVISYLDSLICGTIDRFPQLTDYISDFFEKSGIPLSNFSDLAETNDGNDPQSRLDAWNDMLLATGKFKASDFKFFKGEQLINFEQMQWVAKLWLNSEAKNTPSEFVAFMQQVQRR